MINYSRSDVMKKAWAIRKNNGFNMSLSLKKAWSFFKNQVAETIEEVKEQFWTAWKTLKSCNYNNGFRNDMENNFYSVSMKLRKFTDSEIRNVFGKYADFAISKM